MSVTLDVGQPYSDASIELCRIFNTALTEIGCPTIDLRMIPHDEIGGVVVSWLFGPSSTPPTGYAAEVCYTNNLIAISCYEFDELASGLVSRFKETIILSDNDCLIRIGNCLKKILYDKNLVE